MRLFRSNLGYEGHAADPTTAYRDLAFWLMQEQPWPHPRERVFSGWPEYSVRSSRKTTLPEDAPPHPQKPTASGWGMGGTFALHSPDKPGVCMFTCANATFAFQTWARGAGAWGVLVSIVF